VRERKIHSFRIKIWIKLESEDWWQKTGREKCVGVTDGKGRRCEHSKKLAEDSLKRRSYSSLDKKQQNQWQEPWDRQK
jgi:trehalose/maltose hydrolase-like predicted phosphorylase